MSLFARNPRRLLALVMIPACLALSACGGEEETPSTQVVVPEETAAPVAALELTKPPAGEVAEVAGYVTMADERQVRMIIEDGTEQVFLVAPNMAEQVGVSHIASNAGLRALGFLVTYEFRDDRYYILGSQEIGPPFPYPEGGQ